jgi:hypothetical protein
VRTIERRGSRDFRASYTERGAARVVNGSAVIALGRHLAVELTRAVMVVEKEGNKIRARLQRKPALGAANTDDQT